MIPILFPRNAGPKTILSRTDMGLGRLDDCIGATVTEERNGMYELEIEYPVNGVHFLEIDYNSWIKAKPSVGGDVQLFRVYRISKPVNGISTINAEHVSYLLLYALIFVKRWGQGTNPPVINCSDALDLLQQRVWPAEEFLIGEYGFDFYNYHSSDTAEFIIDKVRSMREYLLGPEYSLLTVYGDAEFEFDNFTVNLYNAEGQNTRGSDNGVKIQYGKNMLNLKVEISDQDIITGFYPHIIVNIQDTDTTHNQFMMHDINYYNQSVSPFVMNSAAQQIFPYYSRIIPLDLKDFDRWKNVGFAEGTFVIDGITEQDFYDCVDMYIEAHPETALPYKSIEVSFVDLSSTEEYKNIQPLETINLCDIVTVVHKDWQVNAKFKVVKTEYNVLDERYNNITLGALRKTLN